MSGSPSEGSMHDDEQMDQLFRDAMTAEAGASPFRGMAAAAAHTNSGRLKSWRCEFSVAAASATLRTSVGLPSHRTTLTANGLTWLLAA